MEWIDLLDPARSELEDRIPASLRLDRAHLDRLAAREPAPRPTLQVHRQGGYVFGILIVPAVKVVHGGADTIFHREIDVALNQEAIVTVRKTPAEGPAFDPSRIRERCRHGEAPALVAHGLFDAVADEYVALVDALNGEIDELEDVVSQLSAPQVRERLKALRQVLLRIRQTLTPTREAVSKVVHDQVDLGSDELFPQALDLAFQDTYEKLLHATEGLDLCRDLLGGVRDYHQAEVANRQNEIMKRLTVVAAVVLVPSLIVGVFGQNFPHFPGTDWNLGPWFSIGLIVAVTLGQLAFFRWKRWL